MLHGVCLFVGLCMWLFVCLHDSLMVVRCVLFVGCRLLVVACGLLFVVYCLLFRASCSVFVVCCL